MIYLLAETGNVWACAFAWVGIAWAIAWGCTRKK